MPRAASGPEFSVLTKRTLAQRVAHRCSNPDCARLTVGPHSEPGRSLLTGEAAHIRAALRGAARFDSTLEDADRRAIGNGIWLCRDCHAHIDKNERRYSPALLETWKARTEAAIGARHRVPTRSVDPIAFGTLAALPTYQEHDLGEDVLHVPRTHRLAELDDALADLAVRAVAVEGLGGAGKTSLVGHWLRRAQTVEQRPLAGLFYWSFYADTKTDRLIGSFLRWVEARHDTGSGPSGERPIEAFERVITTLPPYLLVLDGLEVLQHAMSEGRDYGRLVDTDLHDLVAAVRSIASPWLVVTTSRFPVPELGVGTSMRRLSLDALEPDEAIELLGRMHVRGPGHERRRVAEAFRYHPLSLRLFGLTLPREERGEPARHLERMLAGLSEASPLRERVAKLLGFYEKRLDRLQLLVLQCVALFRSAVAVEVVEAVAGVLSDEPIDGVALELLRLHDAGVLVLEALGNEDGYACHPVVRDHFRMGLLNQDAGGRVVDLLADRPDALGLTGVTNLERLVLVIEVLNDIGRHREAYQLYVERLDEGRELVRRAWPHEAVRVFEAFINPTKRGPSASPAPVARPRDLSVRLLVPAAMFDLALGELASAKRRAEQACAVMPGSGRADPFRVRAWVAYHRGEMERAVEWAHHASSHVAGAGFWGAGGVKRALGLSLLVRCLTSWGRRTDAQEGLAVLESLGPELDAGDASLAAPMAAAVLELTSRDASAWERLCRELRGQAAIAIDESLAVDARLIACHLELVRGGVDPEAELEALRELTGAKSYRILRGQVEVLVALAARRHGRPVRPVRLEEVVRQADDGGYRLLQAAALWAGALVHPVAADRARLERDARALATHHGYATLTRVFPKSLVTGPPMTERRVSTAPRP